MAAPARGDGGGPCPRPGAPRCAESGTESSMSAIPAATVRIVRRTPRSRASSPLVDLLPGIPPRETVARAFELQHQGPELALHARGPRLNHDRIADLERVSRHAGIAKLRGPAPFDGPAFLRPVVALRHHVHERVRIAID